MAFYFKFLLTFVRREIALFISNLRIPSPLSSSSSSSSPLAFVSSLSSQMSVRKDPSSETQTDLSDRKASTLKPDVYRVVISEGNVKAFAFDPKEAVYEAALKVAEATGKNVTEVCFSKFFFHIFFYSFLLSSFSFSSCFMFHVSLFIVSFFLHFPFSFFPLFIF